MTVTKEEIQSAFQWAKAFAIGANASLDRRFAERPCWKASKTLLSAEMLPQGQLPQVSLAALATYFEDFVSEQALREEWFRLRLAVLTHAPLDAPIGVFAKGLGASIGCSRWRQPQHTVR
jgi:hypothetical protein